MNATSKKLKDENKWSNCQNLFSFVARNFMSFLSFGVHRSMIVDNTIEKLQKVAREKGNARE
jgi:hypothetical protein